MPSPVGHALAGAAIGWLVLPRERDASEPPWRAMARGGALCAALAVCPDLDLLVGVHRGPTHSLAAACGVGLVLFAVTRLPRVALAGALAYASHVFLDWLGADSSPPLGLQALWPFTRQYYESGLHFFPAVSRRYWADDFVAQNARALLWEVGVLGPLAVGAKLRTMRIGEWGLGNRRSD